MRTLLTIIFTVFLCRCVYAQQVYHIEGAVYGADSSVLSAATVQAFEASKLISYAITNGDGRFKLEISKSGKYWLKTTYLGYHSDSTTITISKEAPSKIEIYLRESVSILEQVTVQSNALGLELKKDTIIYDLNVHHTGNEETLGDMLNELPGVEVRGGDINVNGQKLDNLLVNGQVVFGNKHKITMDNIDVDMIEGVAYYDNYRDQYEVGSNDRTNETALNVTLKEQYAGKIGGHVLGGVGVSSRYKAETALFNIKETANTSVTLKSQNTEKEILSLSELSNILLETSGVNEKGGAFVVDERIVELTRPVTECKSASQNFGSFNLERKLGSYGRLTFFTMGMYTDKSYHKENDIELNTSNDTILNYTKEEMRSKISFNNSVLKLDYHKDKSASYHYRADFTLMSTDKSNDSFRRTYADSQYFNTDNYEAPLRLKQQVRGVNKIGENWYWEKSMEYDVYKKDGDMHIISDTSFLDLTFQNDKYRMYQPVNRKGGLLKVSTSLLFQLDSYHFGFKVRLEREKSKYKSHLSTNEQDKDKRIYENDLLLKRSLEAVGFVAKYSSDYLNIDFNPEIRFYDVSKNLNHNRHNASAWRFVPNLDVKYNLGYGRFFRLRYEEDISNNEIENYTEYPIVTNYQQIVYGAIPLHYINEKHQIRLNYFDLNTRSGNILNLYAIINYFPNLLTFNNNTNSEQTVSQRKTGVTKTNIIGGMTWEKSLLRLPYAIRLKTFYTTLWQNYFNEGTLAENKLHHIRVTVAMRSMYEPLFNFWVGTEIDNEWMDKVSGARQLHVSPYVKTKSKWKSGFKLHTSLSYDYSRNRPYTTEQYIINLKFSYQKPKGKCEYGLEGWNILNFKNTDRVESLATQNKYVRSINSSLPGYLMFYVNWSLN